MQLYIAQYNFKGHKNAICLLIFLDQLIKNQNQEPYLHCISGHIWSHPMQLVLQEEYIRLQINYKQICKYIQFLVRLATFSLIMSTLGTTLGNIR